MMAYEKEKKIKFPLNSDMKQAVKDNANSENLERI